MEKFYGFQYNKKIQHFEVNVNLKTLFQNSDYFLSFIKIHYFNYALMWQFLKNSFILEEVTFRSGLDSKMRRMWLGLEIVEARLPPLHHNGLTNIAIDKQFGKNYVI